MGKPGINYKKREIYQDRIVVRQLSQDHKICATYEEYLSFTSQSFYNLKILESSTPNFNHHYLLGILNSTLLSYYFIKSFGSYKKLFPRILIEKLKELPIKIPEDNEQEILAKKISKKVQAILKKTKKDLDEIPHLQEEIDKLVFKLYNLNEDEKQYISAFMKNL